MFRVKNLTKPIAGQVFKKISQQSTSTFFRSFNTTPIANDKIVLSKSELNEGYESLHQRLNELIIHAASIAVISPVFSGIWLLATDQMLLNSPIAMTSFLGGGMFVVGRIKQMKQVKNYAYLSTIVNPAPAISEESNVRIKKIIAGENPKINFNTHGLTISGPVGDIDHPSSSVQYALSRIDSMERVVLPSCILTKEADSLVDLTQTRWLTRLTMPFALINLATIASKDPKDRTIDDYVVLGSSAYSIFDYMNGPSLADARQKLTESLANCRTPHDVLKFFIDNQILDKGGMSFLNEWIKKQDSVGVRVGRTGVPILYKSQKSSFGGPYPIRMFPQKRSQEEIPTSEATISHSRKNS